MRAMGPCAQGDVHHADHHGSGKHLGACVRHTRSDRSAPPVTGQHEQHDDGEHEEDEIQHGGSIDPVSVPRSDADAKQRHGPLETNQRGFFHWPINAPVDQSLFRVDGVRERVLLLECSSSGGRDLRLPINLHSRRTRRIDPEPVRRRARIDVEANRPRLPRQVERQRERQRHEHVAEDDFSKDPVADQPLRERGHRPVERGADVDEIPEGKIALEEECRGVSERYANANAKIAKMPKYFTTYFG